MSGYPDAAAPCLAAPVRSGSRRQHLVVFSLLGLCCCISTSLPWQGAQLTTFVKDETSTHDPDLRPTTAPALLFKRQSRGPDTCGFIDGDIERPLTCSNPLKTCVTDVGLNAFACCDAVTTAPLSVTFTDCGFRTACVNFVANSTGAVNPLIQTCVSGLPICQEFALNGDSDGSGTFTDFVCGTFPLIQSVEISAKSTLTSSISTQATSSPLTSGSAPALPTAISSSKGLPGAKIAGIAVGVAVSSALVGFLLWCYWNSRRRKQENPGINRGGQELLQRDDTKVSESKGSNLGLSGLDPDSFSDQLNSLSPSELTIWTGFLSIYGEQGILLRELIMLVSALYPPVVENCGYAHWSHNGKRGLSKPAKSENPVLTLLKEASKPEELQAMEDKLVYHGVITVKNAGHLGLSTRQDWVTDSRSWCARSDHPYNQVNPTRVCLDLLALYSQIPDRDVHLMAERYREMSYYHAHFALVFIFPMLRDEQVILDDVKIFRNVALQVFSHRYQPGDAEMIEFIKGRVVPTPHGLRTTSDIVHISHWRIMLQTVELRAAVARHSPGLGSSTMQSLLQDTVIFFHQTVDQQTSISRRTWGMVGYALTELMDITETAHELKAFGKIVRLARAWCGIALESGTPIEMAALCCVFVRLKAFDELERMPQENHLSCGYYLARAGFLRTAAQYILSGIHYCEQHMPKAPIWRYQLELLTVKIRLGQWKEAEHWLSNTWEGLSTRSDHLPAGKFDLWKQSGELGEFRMSLASLLSDCYTSQGRFVEARTMIVTALENTHLMQDVCFRVTRVALKSRLLSVQLELQDLRSAAATALDLCRELQDRKNFHLERQTMSWTVQELLVCVNELVHEELYENTCHVLRDLRRIENLPGDLSAPIDQKLNEVKLLTDPWDSVTLGASVSDLILPLDSSVQPLAARHETQSQALGLGPITQELVNDVQSHGYTFPVLASRAEATLSQESTIMNHEHQGPETTPQTPPKSGKQRVDFRRRLQLIRKKKLSALQNARVNPALLELEDLPRPPKSDLLSSGLDSIMNSSPSSEIYSPPSRRRPSISDKSSTQETSSPRFLRTHSTPARMLMHELQT